MQYGPKIVTDSLVLALDAADNNSAPHNDLPVKKGCVTWLDGADDDVFSYSSGTLVSQWRDKSGNDNHVSQSTTSSQPTRNRTLNSKSVVDFDGSNDSLSSSNSLTLSSGHTMFAVTLTDAFSSDAGLISINNQLSNGITVHTGGLVYFYYGSGGYHTTQGVNLSTSYILTKVWTGATSGNRISYKNGTQGYSTGTMANSNSTGVLRLGQQSTYYNGYIAEVVIYNRELSQDEITKVHNYLQNKWNISVSDAKWYDRTANANNGTPTNDPTYSETNKGYFDFDGTDDAFDLPVRTVDGLTTYSISFWVNFDTWSTGSTYGNIYCEETGLWIANYYDKIGFDFHNGNTWIDGNGGTVDSLQITVPASDKTGTWLHVTATYSGSTSSTSATITGYLNGSQNFQVTTSYASGSNSRIAFNGSTNYKGGIGYRRSYNSYYFDGKIANMSMYNKVLTSAEVLQNYNATKGRYL